MKKLKSFRILGMLGLVIIAFSLSVLLAQPSDARSVQYQRLIEQGIIDAVITPHELGLDYLEHEPVELAADSGLLSAIYEAEQEVSIMPEDIPLQFPGGTNSPIRIGQIPDDTGTPGAASRVMFIGFVGRDGQARSFTPNQLGSMFNTEYNNGGNLTVNADSQDILLADASGTFLQARRIPVIDLIVRNPRNGRRYVVRRVNANAVCRDAINGVHNRTLRRI
ncbi:MAG: hypothetical protein AB4426_22675 [Xenococcaceae cyanobacterium]